MRKLMIFSGVFFICGIVFAQSSLAFSVCDSRVGYTDKVNCYTNEVLNATNKAKNKFVKDNQWPASAVPVQTMQQMPQQVPSGVSTSNPVTQDLKRVGVTPATSTNQGQINIFK